MKLPAASVWLGLAAAAAGLFAFYAAQRYLTDSSAEVERAWQARYAPRDVLVAARDLDPGRPLAAPDLAKRAVPSAFVPGGAFEPARLSEVIGKPLLLPLRAGDPIVDSQVAGRNETALAARLSDGARAVTVPVDEVSSQAGLVRPGDRVDLMLAEEIESSDERCIRVKPLLESLAVLATGRVQGDATQGAEALLRRGIDATSYSTITLDVTPEQAQQLALALRVGELIPLLRGDAD
ncbi:MAG: Flp pilus assembly protein CpaB, partial [Gammaproteobacteria bacterium]|nr:Flp pilus assembly protein CpaB [Gammaproteobacteria bacterium]